MAVYLSQGTQLAIAATYGATKTMSAITNATEAVATLEASHGVVADDIIEITSGWDRLNYRVVRADSVNTNDVTLEDINTSSTTFYPTGSGTGSIREIATWTSITQITSISSSNPSTSFADVTTLANQTRQRIPSLEDSPDLTFEVLYDPAATWLTTAYAASDANSLVAIRMTLPSGAVVYVNGYFKISRFPRLGIGEAIKASGTISFVSTPTFYAA